MKRPIFMYLLIENIFWARHPFVQNCYDLPSGILDFTISRMLEQLEKYTCLCSDFFFIHFAKNSYCLTFQSYFYKGNQLKTFYTSFDYWYSIKKCSWFICFCFTGSSTYIDQFSKFLSPFQKNFKTNDVSMKYAQQIQGRARGVGHICYLPIFEENISLS